MHPENVASSPSSLAAQLARFWAKQVDEWPALAAGLAALRQADSRHFDLSGERIVVLCNPARLVSSSANIDPAAIAQRPCFLCPEQRPSAQRALAFDNDWLILCNPAPIFEPHFTIVHRGHRPQRFAPALPVMFDLARDLTGAYTVFYNGPVSGASAPDHLHLQAVPSRAMPYESQLVGALRPSGAQALDIAWLELATGRIGFICTGLRPAIVFVGWDRAELAGVIELAVHVLEQVRPASPEPMFNLYVGFSDRGWLAWVFPRAAHRPACYGTGPGQYLISPGAIDLGGVFVAPRPADFDRLTAATISAILREVLLSPEAFAVLRDRVSNALVW